MTAAPAVFRLLLAPGVHPDRWARVWRERLPDVPLELVPVAAGEALAALRRGEGVAALAPAPAPGDDDDLAVVRLYEETTVVVVPRDHWLTAGDEVDAADLAGETRVVPADDVLAGDGTTAHPAADGGVPGTVEVATTAEAVELVAAGTGVLVVPLSLARLHDRRDVVHRPLRGAPTVTVVLAWRRDDEAVADGVDLHQELVGIVRGRTARSSRGGGAAATPATPAAAQPRRAPGTLGPGPLRSGTLRPGGGSSRGGSGAGRGRGRGGR
ncbi:LysR substrate-binding domain-containing protein [Cellulomonas marina]|uniref:LysR substrate binding domain-containing protein n=1 Tax=Cellulomonas marina TaxID=988821 RepID=A0A1I0ZHF7_9CELL|nr:LysR substrate-binding domain-containing protein [Cellulomonas marina]GIG28565.1 hypothetical protein Cma02nite_11650 [Cellulomonas marina]SFB24812.1 LysR substrate binding domain-containing protein [Cellulomonas marina]